MEHGSGGITEALDCLRALDAAPCLSLLCPHLASIYPHSAARGPGRCKENFPVGEIGEKDVRASGAAALLVHQDPRVRSVVPRDLQRELRAELGHLRQGRVHRIWPLLALLCKEPLCLLVQLWRCREI